MSLLLMKCIYFIVSEFTADMFEIYNNSQYISSKCKIYICIPICSTTNRNIHLGMSLRTMKPSC